MERKVRKITLTTTLFTISYYCPQNRGEILIEGQLYYIPLFLCLVI